MENQYKKNTTIGSTIFVGCMFLGMGIGMAFEQTGIGMFIGMGVGFIASGVFKISTK